MAKEITTKGVPLTDEQRAIFTYTLEADDIAVMSGYVNGEHTAIIVRTTDTGDSIKVTPIYVAVTPGMELTDGEETAPKLEA